MEAKPERTPRTRVDASARLGVEVVLWTLLTWGVWLVSLSVVDNEDLLVGGVAALVCGLAATGVRRRLGLSWRPRLSLLRPMLLLPISITVDAVAVLLAAWRPSGRGARIIEVDIGAAGHGPEAAARRAVMIAVVSATPSSVVLDADPESGRLVVHTLRSPAPAIHERYATR